MIKISPLSQKKSAPLGRRRFTPRDSSSPREEWSFLNDPPVRTAAVIKAETPRGREDADASRWREMALRGRGRGVRRCYYGSLWTLTAVGSSWSCRRHSPDWLCSPEPSEDPRPPRTRSPLSDGPAADTPPALRWRHTGEVYVRKMNWNAKNK